jgi:hypothetical protein
VKVTDPFLSRITFDPETSLFAMEVNNIRAGESDPLVSTAVVIGQPSAAVAFGQPTPIKASPGESPTGSESSGSAHFAQNTRNARRNLLAALQMLPDEGEGHLDPSFV